MKIKNVIILAGVFSCSLSITPLCAQIYTEIPHNGQDIAIEGLADEIDIIGHDKSNVILYENYASNSKLKHKYKKGKLWIELQNKNADYQIYVPKSNSVKCNLYPIFYEGSEVNALDNFKQLSIHNLEGNIDVVADAYHVNLNNQQGNAAIVTYGNINAIFPTRNLNQKVVLDTYLGSIDVALNSDGIYKLQTEAGDGLVEIDKAIQLDDNSTQYINLHSEKGIKIHVSSLQEYQALFNNCPIKYILDPSRTDHVKGIGKLLSQKRVLSSSYNSIVVENGIQLHINTSHEDFVKVIAEKNIIPMVETKIKAGVLYIQLSNPLETSKGVKVELHTSNDQVMELLSKSGSYTNFDTKNLQRLNLTVMGGSEVELSGKVAHADIFVKGGSILQAQNCQIENLNILAKSASEAKVNVSNKLNATADNWGKILYKGNPKEKTIDLLGEKSKIRKMR